jgi:hypothetical protein
VLPATSVLAARSTIGRNYGDRFHSAAIGILSVVRLHGSPAEQPMPDFAPAAVSRASWRGQPLPRRARRGFSSGPHELAHGLSCRGDRGCVVSPSVRDLQPWPEHAHGLAGSQPPPDCLHIAQREKRAPVARQCDRAKIAAAQPRPNCLGRDAKDSSDFRLSVYEGRSHAANDSRQDGTAK